MREGESGARQLKSAGRQAANSTWPIAKLRLGEIALTDAVGIVLPARIPMSGFDGTIGILCFAPHRLIYDFPNARVYQVP